MGKTVVVPGLIKHTGYLGKHNPQGDTPERQSDRLWLLYVAEVLRESTVDRSQLGVSEGLSGELVFKRRPEG